MIDPVQAFLQANALKTPLFPATSRYYSIGSATLPGPDGRTVVYLKRRFLPQPDDLALLQEHSVSTGDRIDNLAQQYLGDAEQYWRLCDGNGAMNPAELTDTVGRKLRVTLPEGIPDRPMANGIQLTLLMGPVIAIPAPPLVIDALDSVTVTTAAGSTSGFQMSFTFTSKSELNTIFILAAGNNTSLGTPPLRVILIVTLNGAATVLFDGVMTNVEVQAGRGAAAGQVTVTGDDLTKVMDLFDFSGLPYPAMPVEARVALICAKYAVFGLIPMVIPLLFTDVPIPVDKIPAHKGTDLQYVQWLAAQAGYVFYVEPGPVPGTNIAYFGPEIKVGVPQPALNLDMDAHTNVESLKFNFDAAKGVLPVVYIQNQLTRAPIPIPIPNLNPLQPPLGLLPTPIAKIKLLKDTAKLSPMQAISRGLAAAACSQDAVTATGSLDVLRYGRTLKARQLVGVRGAGVAYDGLYYVQSVTSTLKRGEFKQSFQLTRNGLVSVTPRVVP